MSAARFVTLAPSTRAEELAAEHIIQEHHLGWSLAEILGDEAIAQRCSETQIGHVLDRTEVVQAVGADLRELRRSMRHHEGHS